MLTWFTLHVSLSSPITCSPPMSLCLLTIPKWHWSKVTGLITQILFIFSSLLFGALNYDKSVPINCGLGPLGSPPPIFGFMQLFPSKDSAAHAQLVVSVLVSNLVCSEGDEALLCVPSPPSCCCCGVLRSWTCGTSMLRQPLAFIQLPYRVYLLSIGFCDDRQ